MQTLLDWLYALQRQGIKVGLEHTRALLDCCGTPQAAFPAIHVAGTNGKGSVCALIAAILRAAGYRVGLYTSPHLVRFNERVRIDGVPIADETIAIFTERYRPAIERIRATFFEATTALAFWYFAQEKVDLAVVETGLGGRLDSTNVLAPVLTVITPVAVDHTALLGTDLRAIAAEKAGIIKPGVPLVLAPQAEAAREVITRRATESAAPLIPVLPPEGAVELTVGRGTAFCWRGRRYHTALLGSHQALNAAGALMAVETFDKNLSPAACAAGLRNVSWPGRMQQLRRRPPVFYDVAHNAQGLTAVFDNLACLYPRPPIGVLAVKSDKELDLIAQALHGRCTELVVTSAEGHDLLPAAELERVLTGRGVACRASVSLPAALDWLTARADRNTPGLVFGSH